MPGETTDGELEEMPHCSQFKTRASCNCGQTQGDRDDPFDHKVSAGLCWELFLHFV